MIEMNKANGKLPSNDTRDISKFPQNMSGLLNMTKQRAYTMDAD